MPSNNGDEPSQAPLAQRKLVSAELIGPLQTGHLSIAMVRADSGMGPWDAVSGSWRREPLPLEKGPHPT
jgi:hypothetical protein